MSPGNFRLNGCEEPATTPLPLRAGPLALRFHPENGFVRGICLGDREVLRGIYMAVRDRNWGTVPARVVRLTQEVCANRFELSFGVECRAGEIHFCWNGRLSGAADGTLHYTFDGQALTTFLKNRIGFCVLHPLTECCGAPARYDRLDGYGGEVRFPMLIEPQIVGRGTFSSLRRLAHEVGPGCWAQLEFQGEVFETEDQRNWTDASFKTYGTPLALPFPAEIKAGTRLHQSITLRLRDGNGCELVTPPFTQPVLAEPVSVQTEKPSGMALAIPREPAAPMPCLGLGVSGEDTPLSAQEVARLSILQLDHLRADLRMADPGWPRALNGAIRQAQQLGIALELALHLGRDDSTSALQACGAELKKAGVAVARILAFRQFEAATSLTTLQQVRRHLGISGVAIGGGSDAHFCELNREQSLGRFGLAEADFVSWPISPQVHAFDDLTLMENLEAQPHTVVTARAFAENKPLVISPITLRPRFNAVATAEHAQDPAQLPPQVDPRQLSLFNAAWTLGSLVALAGAQVASLTYFETTGWRGLMESRTPLARHPLFPSHQGMMFPVYHVFAALAGFSRMASVCPDQRCRNTLASLCAFDPQGNRRLLCANLTDSGLPLALNLGVKRASIRTLDAGAMDEDTWPAWSPAAQQDCPSGVLRLTLAPYAIASLDSA